MDRNCNTCMFKNLGWRVEPCASCDRDCDKWVPAVNIPPLKMSFIDEHSLYTSRYKTFSMLPPITKVIFNDPATIVLWGDGTKTVVKRQDFDTDYDPEKGLAMCICKKVMGNKGRYYNVFNEWLPQAEVMTPNEIREHMGLEPSKEEIDILQMENAVDECDVVMTCDNCKYEDVGMNEEPCCKCVNTVGYKEFWEPKDE